VQRIGASVPLMPLRAEIFCLLCRLGQDLFVLDATSRGNNMRYAIFCYQAEDEVFSMSKAQDDAMMAALTETKNHIRKKTKFGPVARLMPTTSATTVR